MTKEIPPPFVPQVRNEVDTGNFSEEFTNMAPTYSPAIAPVDAENLFKVRRQVTRGYPHWFFSLDNPICFTAFFVGNVTAAFK